jgi:hypothetical protein
MTYEIKSYLNDPSASSLPLQPMEGFFAGFTGNSERISKIAVYALVMVAAGTLTAAILAFPPVGVIALGGMIGLTSTELFLGATVIACAVAAAITTWFTKTSNETEARAITSRESSSRSLETRAAELQAPARPIKADAVPSQLNGLLLRTEAAERGLEVANEQGRRASNATYRAALELERAQQDKEDAERRFHELRSVAHLDGTKAILCQKKLEIEKAKQVCEIRREEFQTTCKNAKMLVSNASKIINSALAGLASALEEALGNELDESGVEEAQICIEQLKTRITNVRTHASSLLSDLGEMQRAIFSHAETGEIDDLAPIFELPSRPHSTPVPWFKDFLKHLFG